MLNKCVDEGIKIDIAQVPAVVKAAIKKETAGCTIEGIVKKEVDGKACYEVECLKDGMEKTLKFEEGSIVTGKVEKGKSSSVTSCC